MCSYGFGLNFFTEYASLFSFLCRLGVVLDLDLDLDFVFVDAMASDFGRFGMFASRDDA